MKGATRQKRARTGLRVEELDGHRKRGDDLLGPVLERLRRLGDQAREVVGDRVEGVDEGVLLRLEVGVEDPVGDGRPLRDLGDRGLPVSALGRQFGDGRQKALALGLRDLLRREPVVAAGERPEVGAGRALTFPS